jgi:hypothetical protein
VNLKFSQVRAVRGRPLRLAGETSYIILIAICHEEPLGGFFNLFNLSGDLKLLVSLEKKALGWLVIAYDIIRTYISHDPSGFD